ncbi:alcohol dehydrogenase catalytic domain-containing protein [Streptomyces actinomycinicus]|uniref:alcohol dehydrogenase catalytic domain-containing protein n=1 Tax=Streptomyces actinomycinicus TaxID=1695166 RepID=UPI003558EC06
MRAIGQDVFGGPEVLKIVEAVRPEAGPAELLVRVVAAGVNPTDAWHRSSGGLAGGDGSVRLGWDVSGVVEAVGAGVTTLAPGDEVFGMPRHPRPAGCYAEYEQENSRRPSRRRPGRPRACRTAGRARRVRRRRPGRRSSSTAGRRAPACAWPVPPARPAVPAGPR